MVILGPPLPRFFRYDLAVLVGLFLCGVWLALQHQLPRVSTDRAYPCSLRGARCGISWPSLSRKLTKKLVENLGVGWHSDSNGLCLVVDPSGARGWIVRLVVNGQKLKKGAPLCTDFGLGGADVVTINQAGEPALEYANQSREDRNLNRAGLSQRTHRATGHDITMPRWAQARQYYNSQPLERRI